MDGAAATAPVNAAIKTANSAIPNILFIISSHYIILFHLDNNLTKKWVLLY
ncbi:MAG: hypothetical protein ACXVHO_09585 [Methanobacterium sp.]